MKKVAVIFADGFEEIEGVSIVDVLRRGGVEAHMGYRGFRDGAQEHGTAG